MQRDRHLAAIFRLFTTDLSNVQPLIARHPVDHGQTVGRVGACTCKRCGHILHRKRLTLREAGTKD